MSFYREMLCIVVRAFEKLMANYSNLKGLTFYVYLRVFAAFSRENDNTQHFG